MDEIEKKLDLASLGITKSEFQQWVKEAIQVWLNDKYLEAQTTIGKWTIRTALATLIAGLAYLILVIRGGHQ